ncbi:tetratricopeptide repeat protein [Dactylosporangium sp. NPDC049140]|uniref:tetratricopeptide repeat protein n=1 Tax=Dactylosporangium sp. NPDC049140 TaxID=3155647 RepID=UPI0034098020
MDVARTRLFCAEHLDTLDSRSNLAGVLRDQGRYDDAEAEHQAVLEARTRLFGAEHLDTLSRRAQLATTSPTGRNSWRKPTGVTSDQIISDRPATNLPERRGLAGVVSAAVRCRAGDLSAARTCASRTIPARATAPRSASAARWLPVHERPLTGPSPLRGRSMPIIHMECPPHSDKVSLPNGHGSDAGRRNVSIMPALP